MQKPAKSKRTASLTARLTPELEEALKDESEKQGITTSALIANVLTRYTQWDRPTERLGFLTTDRQSFKMILDSANDEDVARAGRTAGDRMRDSILFWHTEVTIHDFVQELQNLCKYGGIAEFQLQRLGNGSDYRASNQLVEKGGNYKVALYHELGSKWSSYCKNLVERSLTSMFNLSARFELGENSITFTVSIES